MQSYKGNGGYSDAEAELEGLVHVHMTSPNLLCKSRSRLESKSSSDEIDSVGKQEFDAKDRELAKAFCSMDRNGTGKVGMEEILRSLRLSNSLFSAINLQQAKEFLEEAIPAYSSSGKLGWSFEDFKRFMEDSALLEKCMQDSMA